LLWFYEIYTGNFLESVKTLTFVESEVKNTPMKKFVAIALLMFAVRMTAIAQPPPPSGTSGAGGGAAQAPLDGGLIVLAVAGASIGAKHRMKKK
jgi:hypothetical protein